MFREECNGGVNVKAPKQIQMRKGGDRDVHPFEKKGDLRKEGTWVGVLSTKLAQFNN
jgi:hypothetical protein